MRDKVLSTPLFFPAAFKEWLSDYVATNIPLIPYGQVLGTRVNTAKSASFIATSESTGSASYTDLATVGPEIKNIADGTYVIFFGANCRSRCAVMINSTEAVDNDSLRGTEGQISMGRTLFKTLKNNHVNSAKMRYKTGAAFKDRWMVLLRVGTG